MTLTVFSWISQGLADAERSKARYPVNKGFNIRERRHASHVRTYQLTSLKWLKWVSGVRVCSRRSSECRSFVPICFCWGRIMPSQLLGCSVWRDWAVACTRYWITCWRCCVLPGNSEKSNLRARESQIRHQMALFECMHLKFGTRCHLVINSKPWSDHGYHFQV